MTTYFVSNSGNDSKSGKTKVDAWKSLAKVNSVTLNPGDKILFKRGGKWQGILDARWEGTAELPITIGAYGKGEMPIIRNSAVDVLDGSHINVKVSGMHLIIDGIDTTIVDPPTIPVPDPEVGHAPVGWFVGFNFVNTKGANGGSYNRLQNCRATYHTAGVHMQTNTHHNTVTGCTFMYNNVMERLTPVTVGALDDIGAWGCLIKGSYHTISGNYFEGNNAPFGYDTLPQGNSVELYEARHCVISHNIAVNDRVFSELGSSDAVKSTNNLFAYNLVVSNIIDAKFITTRGAESEYGPVYATQLFQNTVHLTGAKSQALICGAGSHEGILTARNNIFGAVLKTVYSDGPFIESNNIYYNPSGGTIIIQLTGFGIDATSKKVNPQYVDPVNGDFHLQKTSPAIDKGATFYLPKDLDGVLVPQGAANDIGCYEFILV